MYKELGLKADHLDIWYANGTCIHGLVASHAATALTPFVSPRPPPSSAPWLPRAAWISVYQIFWGLLTFWTVFIPPFVAPHPPLTMSEFPTFVSNANKCFFGESVSIVSNTTSFMDTCMSGGNVWDAAEGACEVNCNVKGSPIAVFCVYMCVRGCAHPAAFGAGSLPS